MQQVPRGRCGFEGGPPRLSRPRFISRRIALSAAVFAASAVGFYRLEKKARSVSRFLILSRRATGMKRIGKSDRVKETVQKRAYIPGVARNRSVVRPWRLAAPSGCAAKCGGLFGLGALLPK